MSKFDENKLLITSDFYTVQGEGISTGIPSYFVRLGVCNLSCGMSTKWFNDLVKKNAALPEDQKMADGEIFEGDLHASGQATWTCDSTSQWALRGENKDFQYLIDTWKAQGVYDDIVKGNIHIIWTGGEPTIIQHQRAIVNFTNFFSRQGGYIVRTVGYRAPEFEPFPIFRPYYEIETNGTVYIEDELFFYLKQINCSPKLSNSGMSEKQRIKPDAINRIKSHKNYQFKFVISTEDDVKEMFETYIIPFEIPLQNVVCMPGMDSQEEYFERTQFVLEMAKKYRFRGMSRLHIAAWDKTLNV